MSRSALNPFAGPLLGACWKDLRISLDLIRNLAHSFHPDKLLPDMLGYMNG